MSIELKRAQKSSHVNLGFPAGILLRALLPAEAIFGLFGPLVTRSSEAASGVPVHTIAVNDVQNIGL